MKILFVCLGNICRSPMAEALMRDSLKESDVIIDSAGTGSWNMGEEPHKGTKKILDNLNISYENMHSRQVKQEDFKNFDYIFAMDKQNLQDLKNISDSKYHNKIHLFLDILEDNNKKEVPDPWYTGDFVETRDLITEANKLWIKQIKAQL